MHFLSSQQSIFFTEVILQSPNLVEALGKLAGSPSSDDEAWPEMSHFTFYASNLSLSIVDLRLELVVLVP